MAAMLLMREDVIERSQTLPGFPRAITEILATLDDPEGSLRVLAHYIEQDPLITARVLSVANIAATRSGHMSEVEDIYTATSLIGMSRVREIALISSMGNFVCGVAHLGIPVTYWQHCVAVGICCQELVMHCPGHVSMDAALIAGLLHDIGQLWLYSFNASAYRQCRSQALLQARGIEDVEIELFGVSHSTIGAWLAEHWALSPSIVAAIRYHHRPDAALDDPLVPLVHLGEVLSNALDLNGRVENRVTYLSSAACERFGLLWDDNIRPLFGRIEARSRHADAFFSATGKP